MWYRWKERATCSVHDALAKSCISQHVYASLYVWEGVKKQTGVPSSSSVKACPVGVVGLGAVDTPILDMELYQELSS